MCLGVHARVPIASEQDRDDIDPLDGCLFSFRVIETRALLRIVSQKLKHRQC